ncbi:MAG: hypothetical protein ACJ75F_15310 [Flavisolibacter sp.]|jgi:hypothetical protein
MMHHNISHLLVDITNNGNHEARLQLEKIINDLLVNDFNSLISILYTVDVNEQELKNMLQLNKGIDAAVVIADMLVRRQLQKINTRSQIKSAKDIPEDEKW